ncbi:MAG: DinB family protein [Mucilaginibacter sp.]
MINRPQPDEYAPFAAGYINQVETTDIIGLLEQLKDSTYKLFSSLSDEQGMHAYAEGKWTLKQVLGHMIDTERTFAYRAFVFSRNNIELPGFDQDIYVNNTDFNSQSIQNLASEFKAVREANLFLYKAFTDEQLLRKGIASGYPVSVRALVYMIAGHELHHLKLLRERYLI